MRLPWIARWRYDAATEAVSVFNVVVADYKAMVVAERERYAEVMEKYHALVLSIVATSDPAPPTARTPDDLPAKRERSVVSQTIKEEANGNPKVAAWLQKRARELRAENKSPDEIATELRRWQSTEDVKE